MFLLIFIGDFKIYVISPFQAPDGALSRAGNTGRGVRSFLARGSRPAPRPTWAGPALLRPGRFACGWSREWGRREPDLRGDE